MKKVIWLGVLFIFVFSLTASAQLVDRLEVKQARQNYTGLKPASSPFSLIDLSRLKWTNSYSLSFFSGGNNAGSYGLYQGSLLYEFSRSLSFNINLGIGHNPGALFNSSDGSNAVFFPSFNLDYHPSESFRFSLGFISHPGFYQYPYSQINNLNNRRISE